MKISACPRRIRSNLALYFFLYIAIVLLANANGALGKVDLKTKLILKNIRTHLARKAEEITQKKECESGVLLCETPSDETDINEEESKEEIANLGPTKTFYKPSVKVQLKKQPKERHGDRKGKPDREDETLKTLRHFPKSTAAEKAVGSTPRKKFKIDKEEEKEGGEKIILKKPGSKLKPERVDQEGTKTGKLNGGPPRMEEEKRRKQVHVDGEDEKFQEKKSRRMEGNENERKTKYKNKSRTEGKDIGKPEERTKHEKTTAGRRDSNRRNQRDAVSPAQTFFFFLESNEHDKGDEMCQKHRNIYLSQLRKQKIWALMMFDASAKIPSGILQGNINQYGDFDECLSINAVFKKSPANEPSGIRGKYCLANLDITTDSTSNEALVQAVERLNSFSFIKSSISDPAHFIPRFTSVNWGLCVPDTCPAEDVENFIVNQLRYLNSTWDITVKVDVAEDNCVVKNDLNFKLTGTMIAVVLFYAAVVAAACIATYADARDPKKIEKDMTDEEKLQKELEEASRDITSLEKTSPETPDQTFPLKGKLQGALMAFSLKRNFTRLFEDEKGETIGCINGIKALFSVMLFLAHKTIPLGWTAFSNRLMLTKASNEGMTAILRTSIIYTDSFLLMSGLLTTYNLTREIATNGRIDWGRRMAARYVRLTPALLAILLFYAYIWPHTGSGPLWNVLVTKNSNLCRSYMWRNLLYIQNLFPFEYMCAPQTHQLALDMQLSALAPIFVYFLFRYDKLGFGVLQALFLLSSIMRYLSTSRNDLSVVVYHGMPVSQLYKTADLLYTQTLHRSSPYLMGSIVGYNLQKYKGRVDMPKAFAAVGWIVAFAFGFYSIASPSNMAAKGYNYERAEAAQYAALSPVSWSISLSWVIFACHLGFGGKLNEFLCNKAFLVFSRISYSFYLTQFLVFFYKVGVKRVPEVFTLTGSFDFGEFVIVVIASTIVTLLFDIPMTEIKKIILDKRKRRRKRSDPVPENVVSEEFKHGDLFDETTEANGLQEVGVEPEEPDEEADDEENVDEAIEPEPYDVIDDVSDESFPEEIDVNVEEDEDADVEEETDEVEIDDRFERRIPVRKFDDDEDSDWLKDD